jgi:transcriptional regulator with XRE-family HTH domain
MIYVGPNIKYLRIRKRLSQSDLANMLGVKSNTISNYENNQSSPDFETLNKLVEILEVDFNTLLGVELNDSNAHLYAHFNAHFKPKLKNYRASVNTENQLSENKTEYLPESAKPNIKNKKVPPMCELCNQKDSTITAMQMTINTQKAFIEKLEEIVQELTESGEQKRKVG